MGEPYEPYSGIKFADDTFDATFLTIRVYL